MKRDGKKIPILRSSKSSSDLAVFKELIIANAYQPFKGQGALECFVARADDSLLDVGGNIGLACWSFWYHNKVSRGDSYEPAKGCE